ncbi:MAG: cytochrome c biogenesis protein CcsA [Pirellulales bacterium]|nr:cytochrome c biogenesis protein CcsA [Pirellulales bacterium]
MRNLLVLVALLVIASPGLAESPKPRNFDWTAWRYLPVQDGGRHKPLDTLAWEASRLLANRTSFTAPDTKEKLNPAAFYLAMIFEWPGWDQTAGGHAAAHGGMFAPPVEPDQWDKAPLLRLDYLELRKALGVRADQKYLSPLEVGKAQIRDPLTGATTSFVNWAGKLAAQQSQGLTTFERKGLELADKYWSYQSHRTGKRLEVVPLAGSGRGEWLSVASLMKDKFDDANDPTGGLRKLQTSLQEVRKAYLDRTGDAFQNASSQFLFLAGQFGPKLGGYPSASTIRLEVAYNRWAPFRFAWIFMLLAFVGILLSLGTGWKSFYVASFTAYLAGMLAMLVGFGMRMVISGRAPVTNMYESVVYVALGAALFGLVFELMHRKRYVLTAATAICAIALILADNAPAVLDPSLRPLQPVLRSNFWLVTHVLSITLSYAAFALALGIANIALGYYLVRSKDNQAISSLSRFTYRCLQVGVLLLAAGTILGGVWADYAWGRFWGWDPKEVWALIALLGYLALLHARYVGWIGQFGLNVCSVICFSLVVVAWYGVNFVLGAGLHSYGFGGGGQGYVIGALGLQSLYLGIVTLRAAPQIWAERSSEVAVSQPAA